MKHLGLKWIFIPPQPGQEVCSPMDDYAKIIMIKNASNRIKVTENSCGKYTMTNIRSQCFLSHDCPSALDRISMCLQTEQRAPAARRLRRRSAVSLWSHTVHVNRDTWGGYLQKSSYICRRDSSIGMLETVHHKIKINATTVIINKYVEIYAKVIMLYSLSWL
jgi:hypothetical protein